MAKKKTLEELKLQASKYEKRAKTAREALEKELRLEEERINKKLIETVVNYYKLKNKPYEKEEIIKDIETACKKIRDDYSDADY